jgi:hypothetical protein
MPRAIWITRASLLAVAALAGCDHAETTPSGSAAPSASSPPTAPAAPTASAAAVAPSASASGPVHDCPAGSSGDGSLAKPCDAKGGARMMEVTWTGKMTDGGPSFRVVNKSPTPILYGKIVVYFYDKAGKQLDAAGAKGRPSHACTGNLFSGVMKPAEKAVITFSCVKKDSVPEDATQIEAEMQVVGFADASEKKSEYFWRNQDLTPDKRPKGGVK